MYQTSKIFEDTILGKSRNFVTKIEISGQEIKAKIRSVVYIASANPANSVTIGGTGSAYVQIEMEKPSIDIENTEFLLSIGLNLNGVQEFVPLGYFTTQKPVNDDGMLSLTAYDRMAKLSGAYNSQLEYPVDCKLILREISQLSGVPMESLDNLPDGITIDQVAVMTEDGVDDTGGIVQKTTYKKPFDGVTCREALGYVAQLYARFAVINCAGKIELRWYQDTEYTISASKYYDDLTTTEQNFSVEEIECTTGSDTLTAGTGTATISITNPAMTQEHLDRIYVSLKDFSFLPASLSFFGDIRLDIGDIVSVQDKYGNIIKIPVMSITQDFDGGLMTAIASEGQTETEAEADSQEGPTAKKLKKLELDLLNVVQIVAKKANFEYVFSEIGKFRKLFAEDLVALGAKIGGWTISSDSILIDSTGMSSNKEKYAFWAGEKNEKNGADGSDAPFSVDHVGKMKASGAEVSGDINATTMTAKNAYSLHNSTGEKKEAISSPEASFGNALNIGNGFASLYLKGLIIDPANAKFPVMAGEDGSWGMLCGDVQTINGISLNGVVTAKKYTYSNNGLTTTVWESTVAIRIKVFGTTTGALSASAGYANLGTIKTSITKLIKKICPRTGWIATFRVNPEGNNKIQLGYTVQNGVAADIPANTSINIDETIMIA